VRYVLEGSVRRMGGTVRVNAQLIDAGTGAHLWAEQMDVDQSALATFQLAQALTLVYRNGWEPEPAKVTSRARPSAGLSATP